MNSGRKRIRKRLCSMLLTAAAIFAVFCAQPVTADADPLVLKVPFLLTSPGFAGQNICRGMARGILAAEEYLEFAGEEEYRESAGKEEYLEFAGKEKEVIPVPATGGESVTWIGDSYTVIAEGIIEQMLPGADLYASYGKHTQMDAPEGYGGPSGLSVLQELASDGNLRANLVFALGTNDPIPSVPAYFSYIDLVMTIAGEDRTVVFVTPFTMEAAMGNVNYDCEIEAMREAAAYYPNARVADWADFCQPFLDQFFDGDTVHPLGPDGFACWTDLIVCQLEQAWAEKNY